MEPGSSSLARDDRAPAPPARRPLDAAFAALEGHADATLAQALIALARDRSGAALERVRVFDWDPRREELRGATEPPDGPASDPSIPARGPRSHAWRPERFTAAAGEAWRSGRATIGAAGEDDVPWRGAEVIAALPLESGGRRVGLLIGEWANIGVAETRREGFDRFVHEAATLMRAVERASTERRRARHAQAIAEFARASVSALNLAEALHLAARLAAESSGSRGSAVWRVNADGAPRLEVTFGIAGERERLARALQPIVAEHLAAGVARVWDRSDGEPSIPPEVSSLIGTLAFVPVRAYGRALGAIALYDRAPRGALEPEAYDGLEMAALATVADVLAMVLDQASRFEELQRLGLRTRELQARVAREERLATLGEMAARVATEARNPLASIGAFARRVHRELPESSAHREYLEIVIRENERLERLIGTPLESLPAEPLRLRMENLNDVVQETLRLAGETLVRRRVRLIKKLAPDLPSLLLDVERVRLALTNVLRQALETVPIGGRIRVESRRSGGFAMVEIAHDGSREPGDLVEQLFVPFSSSPTGSPSTLGFAMAQQVIQAHGGEIRARAEAEWTAVLSLTLPIQGNQDRRSPRPDRRQPRADRRRRGPER
jgi:nitrogen-specific signal transduction histidine kinase